MRDGVRASGGASGDEGSTGVLGVPDRALVALTKASLQACTRFMRVLYVSSVHGMGSRSSEESSGVTTEEQ